METELQLAELSQIDDVYSIYQEAINHMNAHHIFQWDEMYPTKDILLEDIKKKQMYVFQKDDIILSIIVINEEQSPEYQSGQWENKNKNVAVIHRLCVNTKYQNKGIGKQTILKAERFLKENNYNSIRLDAFSLNPYALKLYEKLGYVKRGEVVFRKGSFFLYEKTL